MLQFEDHLLCSTLREVIFKLTNVQQKIIDITYATKLYVVDYTCSYQKCWKCNAR